MEYPDTSNGTSTPRRLMSGTGMVLTGVAALAQAATTLSALVSHNAVIAWAAVVGLGFACMTAVVLAALEHTHNIAQTWINKDRPRQQA